MILIRAKDLHVDAVGSSRRESTTGPRRTGRADSVRPPALGIHGDPRRAAQTRPPRRRLDDRPHATKWHSRISTITEVRRRGGEAQPGAAGGGRLNIMPGDSPTLLGLHVWSRVPVDDPHPAAALAVSTAVLQPPRVSVPQVAQHPRIQPAWPNACRLGRPFVAVRQLAHPASARSSSTIVARPSKTTMAATT